MQYPYQIQFFVIYSYINNLDMYHEI